METRWKDLEDLMLRAGLLFLNQGQDPFLKPGILAAHDCLRQAVDDAVFCVPEDSSRRRGRRVQTICHILAEIIDQLTDAGLCAHLWLGGKPERRSHGKEHQAVIDQMLQQQLFIVQALPMAKRREECGSCQAPRGRLDKTNPTCVFFSEYRRGAPRGHERETGTDRHAREIEWRGDLV